MTTAAPALEVEAIEAVCLFLYDDLGNLTPEMSDEQLVAVAEACLTRAAGDVEAAKKLAFHALLDAIEATLPAWEPMGSGV